MHTKHQGGGKGRNPLPPPKYLKSKKCYKRETVGGVRDKGGVQGFEKFQVDITAFVWLPWQLLNYRSNASRIYNYQAKTGVKLNNIVGTTLLFSPTNLLFLLKGCNIIFLPGVPILVK